MMVHSLKDDVDGNNNDIALNEQQPLRLNLSQRTMSVSQPRLNKDYQVGEGEDWNCANIPLRNAKTTDAACCDSDSAASALSLSLDNSYHEHVVTGNSSLLDNDNPPFKAKEELTTPTTEALSSNPFTGPSDNNVTNLPFVNSKHSQDLCNWLLNRRINLIRMLAENHTRIIYLMKEEIDLTGKAPENYQQSLKEQKEAVRLHQYVLKHNEKFIAEQEKRDAGQKRDGEHTPQNENFEDNSTVIGSKVQDTKFLLSPTILRKMSDLKNKHQTLSRQNSERNREFVRSNSVPRLMMDNESVGVRSTKSANKMLWGKKLFNSLTKSRNHSQTDLTQFNPSSDSQNVPGISNPVFDVDNDPESKALLIDKINELEVDIASLKKIDEACRARISDPQSSHDTRKRYKAMCNKNQEKILQYTTKLNSLQNGMMGKNFFLQNNPDRARTPSKGDLKKANERQSVMSRLNPMRNRMNSCTRVDQPPQNLKSFNKNMKHNQSCSNIPADIPISSETVSRIMFKRDSSEPKESFSKLNPSYCTMPRKKFEEDLNDVRRKPPLAQLPTRGCAASLKNHSKPVSLDDSDEKRQSDYSIEHDEDCISLYSNLSNVQLRVDCNPIGRSSVRNLKQRGSQLSADHVYPSASVMSAGQSEQFPSIARKIAGPRTSIDPWEDDCYESKAENLSSHNPFKVFPSLHTAQRSNTTEQIGHVDKHSMSSGGSNNSYAAESSEKYRFPMQDICIYFEPKNPRNQISSMHSNCKSSSELSDQNMITDFKPSSSQLPYHNSPINNSRNRDAKKSNEISKFWYIPKELQANDL